MICATFFTLKLKLAKTIFLQLLFADEFNVITENSKCLATLWGVVRCMYHHSSLCNSKLGENWVPFAATKENLDLPSFSLVFFSSSSSTLSPVRTIVNNSMHIYIRL